MHTRQFISVLLVLVIHAIAARPTAAEPAGGTFDAKGVKIHYLVQGKGEPVVLIHGLFSSAEINWKWPGIIDALAKDHQVIAFDLPAHGASDKPEDPDAYGAQMAEDVVLLMDHLKVKKAHLVGYSLGGMVAGKVMATHSDRVISCVLGGMGWMRDGGALQKFWQNAPMRDSGRRSEAFIHGIAQLAITEDELKAIKLPVIVLIGEQDPVRKLYVEPLQAVRKDWPVIEIRDAGHITCILKPRFKDEIVKWIGDHADK